MSLTPVPSTTSSVTARARVRRASLAPSARHLSPRFVPFVAAGAIALGVRADVSCPADLTGAGMVNVMTVAIVLQQWGENPSSVADLNGDGAVGGWDLGYVLGHWGPCDGAREGPIEGSAALSITDVTSDEAQRLGLRTFDLRLPFQEPDARLLNVFDANVECDATLCTAHAMPLGSPPQALPFLQVLIDAGDVTWDSFVTIGPTATPMGSSVSLDPSFDQVAFTSGGGIGVDAGWFALPVDGDSLAGTWPDLEVLIARLTIPEDVELEGALKVMWQEGSGTLRLDHAEFTLGAAPAADLDGDGVVDGADLGMLLGAWGVARIGEPADLDGGGTVDGADLGILLGAWGPAR